MGAVPVSKDYPLSLSGASARVPDVVVTAKAFLECGDWREARKRILEGNAYMMNPSSAQRIAGELIKRLKTLSEAELRFLVESVGEDRLAMVWLSICRTYPFVQAMAREGLVERMAAFATTFDDGEYAAIMERQAQLHPELDTLTPLTAQKIRSVVFKMMNECGLLDDDRRITPLHPSSAFFEVLDLQRPSARDVLPGVEI